MEGEYSQEKEVNITYNTLLEFFRLEKSREELQPLNEEFFPDVVGYIDYKKRMIKDAENQNLSPEEKDRLTHEFLNIKKILRGMYDRREKKILNMAINKSRTGSNIIDTSTMLEEELMFFDRLVREFDRFRQGILNMIIDGNMPTIIQRDNAFKSHVNNFNDDSLSEYEDSLKMQAEEMKNSERKGSEASFYTTSSNESGDEEIEKSNREISETEMEGELTGSEEESNGSVESTEEAKAQSGSKKKLIRFLMPVPKFVGEELEVYGPFEEEDLANLPESIADVLIKKGRAESMD